MSRYGPNTEAVEALIERKEWVGRRSTVALGTYCDECRGYIKEGLKRFCSGCYEHASERSWVFYIYHFTSTLFPVLFSNPSAHLLHRQARDFRDPYRSGMERTLRFR